MPNELPEPEWESIAASAHAGDTTPQSIYQIIGQGLIEARKMGRKTIVRVASRRAYFDNLPKAQINTGKAGGHA
jgi:hypothetical protein